MGDFHLASDFRLGGEGRRLPKVRGYMFPGTKGTCVGLPPGQELQAYHTKIAQKEWAGGARHLPMRIL